MNHHSRWMQLLLFLLLTFTYPVLADSSNTEQLYNPVNPETANLSLAEKNYVGLREILPLYQQAVLHPWPTIPATKQKLKAGVKNPAVVLLRERLKATHDLPAYYDRSDLIFDKPLVQAVKGFQQRNGLKADGVVGKFTLQELNTPPDVRVKQIVVNMQRWTILAPRLNGRFVMINVPDYELYAFDNNEKILSMKAIVGKPDTETPELQSQISRVVFKPYWNVPTKIAQNEIVKKVQEDPGYLDTMRMKILSSQENNAREIQPDNVNWQAAEENGFPYRFRQEPGMDNALGIVKFEFQNSQDVYLHDTPAKELFNQDDRALSHGCVRLENPLALVDFLLNRDMNWNEERLQDILAADKTKYVKVDQPTPIIITYITAWIDEQGAVNFRNDIYGKD